MSLPAAAEPVSPRGGGATPRHTADAPEDAADGAQPPAGGARRCANCGAWLAGKFCSECGQRHFDHPAHHFSHFVSEAFEDLTHADSRLWRTVIALLFRPGFLTREFLDGHRVRYLPPVRLYLVLSVLFFLILAVVPQATTSPRPIVTRKGSEIVLTPFGAGAVSAASAKKICANFSYTGPWADRLAPRLDANCIKVLSGDRADFRSNFLHTAGRALFLLLPLLALVMKALYRKPRRYYVEHLLFFVHNHAFLFLVLGVYALLTPFVPDSVRSILHFVLWTYVWVYVYASMLRVYAQGWLLTATKLGALFCAYTVLVSFLTAATLLYSVLTL